jgi:hypothetical protein
MGAGRSVVVKAPFYKPEGRGFETWWGDFIFSIFLVLFSAQKFVPKTKIIFVGSRERPVRKTDYLADICEPIV